MESKKYPYLVLTAIHDAHSTKKSTRAITIISEVLENQYDVNYVTITMDGFNSCDNPFTDKLDDQGELLPSGVCNHAIKDVFIIEDRRSQPPIEYNIGNHCIGRLFPEISHKISKLLSTREFCELCGCSANKMHRACIFGTSNRASFAPKKSQAELKQFMHKEIVFTIQYRKLRWLFGNSWFYLLPRRKYTSRGARALERHYKVYKTICDNIDVLKQFKKNALINSVRSGTRMPSVKQTAMLERIISDAPRLLVLDQSPNPPVKYLKYGYTFPRWG